MKKHLTIFAICLTAFLLLYAAPRIYERYLPTDDTAALAFEGMQIEEVGKAVVECLNHHNQIDVWWHWSDDYSLKAYEDFGGPWKPSHYMISGRLGWHVTWVTLITRDIGKVTGYETYGAETKGPLFRVKLPVQIIGSLKRCGVNFGGVYPEEISW